MHQTGDALEGAIRHSCLLKIWFPRHALTLDGLLKEWEAKREKLTVLEMRVEESVFILRDLGVFGI
ncbi:hypothetical protein C8F04DRAFT_1130514, partial [Mycena alexandri]